MAHDGNEKIRMYIGGPSGAMISKIISHLSCVNWELASGARSIMIAFVSWSQWTTNYNDVIHVAFLKQQAEKKYIHRDLLIPRYSRLTLHVGLFCAGFFITRI